MSEEENDGLDPTIRQAFDEIGEVLNRHKLGGMIFAVSSETQAAGWVMHYSETSLVTEQGEYFQISCQHPEGLVETKRRAKLTAEFIDTLLAISEESIQRLMFIAEHARALFVRHGLISAALEIEDAPTDEQAPEHEKN